MKKTTIVNLSGIAFYIEEEAYQRLDKYLTHVREYFAQAEDSTEIIEDIENRIAEKFSNSLTNPQQVISHAKVDEIIKSMGTVEEFEDAEKVNSITEETKENKTKKKLFRDSEDKLIGGIIAGFANYLGFSVKFLRIILGALIAISIINEPGMTFLITFVYFVFYFLLPETKSLTDKMQMKGKAITLSNIQSAIEDQDIAKTNEKRHILVKIILFPFIVIRNILEFIKKFFKVVVTKAVGIFLIGISFLIFLGVTTLAILTAFFKDSPLIESPFSLLDYKANEYFAILFIYLSILIPLIFLMIIGVSIIKRKYILKGMSTLSIIGIWIVSLFVGASLALNAAPGVRDAVRKYDQQNINKIKIDKLSKVYVEGIYDHSITVEILKSEKNEIVVEGKKEYVSVEYQNEEVKIKKLRSDQICLFCYDYTKVTIYTPTINTIELKENSYISLTSFDDLEELNINSKNENFGYSAVTVLGSTNKLNLNLMGNVYIYASDLKVKEVNVEAKDINQIVVKSPETINAKLDHSQIIYTTGEPKINLEITDRYPSSRERPTRVISQKALDEEKRY